jgi:DnaK suppressor protein
LLAKKQEVLTGMGMKFDAAAKLGRVAEDDAVQIAHDEFINLRLNAIGWDQVRLMDEALDRLQTGEFGICMRCDEPISARRLAVVPWAKYCVKCQERLAARESLQEESLQEAFPNHSFR